MQQNETDQQTSAATHSEQDSERHEFGAQTKDSEQVSMETSEDEERALHSATETRDPEETPAPEVLEALQDLESLLGGVAKGPTSRGVERLDVGEGDGGNFPAVIGWRYARRTGLRASR